MFSLLVLKKGYQTISGFMFDRGDQPVTDLNIDSITSWLVYISIFRLFKMLTKKGNNHSYRLIGDVQKRAPFFRMDNNFNTFMWLYGVMFNTLIRNFPFKKVVTNLAPIKGRFYFHRRECKF